MIHVVENNAVKLKYVSTFQRMLELGCSGYIVKPIIAGQFLQKVRNIIGEGSGVVPPAVVPEEKSEGEEVSEEEERRTS